MIPFKKKRTDVRMPRWFTDVVWQPLKGFLTAAETFLLLPLTARALDGLWTFMVWPRPVLRLLFEPLMMAACLLLAFIFWRHYDAIDDVSFLLFVRESDPKPLTRRRTWRLSAGISALGVGAGVRPARADCPAGHPRARRHAP